jgi:hypothetical protein
MSAIEALVILMVHPVSPIYLTIFRRYAWTAIASR